MNKMSPEVDGYIRKNKKWREELEKLRTILLDCTKISRDDHRMSGQAGFIV